MAGLVKRCQLGNTGVEITRIVFSSSAFGNLCQALSYKQKREIAAEWFRTVGAPVVIDTAGKYGAGMALEAIGAALRDLGIESKDVIISNKMGWRQIPLSGPEPTFEPGVWVDLTTDATQSISYGGILDCWQQGNRLLGSEYAPQLVSVHDPDEYLSAASDSADRQRRLTDAIGAYRALHELKEAGEVKAVGVGAKDWTVIRELANQVELDWVMFACSVTVHQHEKETISFVEELNRAGVGIINSAAFNSGFLIEGQYYDYDRVDPSADPELYQWRETFLSACREYDVEPADACVEFALSPPGVVAIALNTSRPDRVRQNVESTARKAPLEFWRSLKDAGLIGRHIEYLG